MEVQRTRFKTEKKRSSRNNNKRENEETNGKSWKESVGLKDQKSSCEGHMLRKTISVRVIGY